MYKLSIILRIPNFFYCKQKNAEVLLCGYIITPQHYFDCLSSKCNMLILTSITIWFELTLHVYLIYFWTLRFVSQTLYVEILKRYFTNLFPYFLRMVIAVIKSNGQIVGNPKRTLRDALIWLMLIGNQFIKERKN